MSELPHSEQNTEHHTTSTLDFYIRHSFACSSCLLELALFLKLREIAGRGCVGDVQEFLHFVIGDVILFQEECHDLCEFLLLSELYRLCCLCKEIFNTVLLDDDDRRLRG